MATAVQVKHPITLTSAVGSTVRSAEYRAGGNPIVFQAAGPAALSGLEGSMDKLNWAQLVDENNNAVATLQNAIVTITRSPTWVRSFVANDAGGPRAFQHNIGVVKESA